MNDLALSEKGTAILPSVPFPEVFVINLDHRVDRWNSIEKLCLDCCLEPVRISAERATPGWTGCGLSHQKIIRAAKEKRLPWVLILEDDASFDKDSITRFRSLLPYLWENRDKWERFSGGPHFSYNPKVQIFDIHHQLMYINGRATHFDLIQNSAYESILAWNPEDGHPIDVFYCELVNTSEIQFRSICTYPHVAVQATSVSDVAGELTDQAGWFRYSSWKLRECLDLAAPHAEGMLEINAIHPEWRGVLLISESGSFLKHKGQKSIGRYESFDEGLIAHWYDFPKETFINVSGVLIHSDMIKQISQIGNS